MAYELGQEWARQERMRALVGKRFVRRFRADCAFEREVVLEGGRLWAKIVGGMRDLPLDPEPLCEREIEALLVGVNEVWASTWEPRP